MRQTPFGRRYKRPKDRARLMANTGLGQLLLSLAVKPIPDNLAEKVPQLRRLHYTFDPTSNAIAIIDPRSNRVITLI